MRSSIWRRVVLSALAVALAAGAQSLQVYSEFTRVDPFGDVVPSDRGSDPPREILSPALPRNAWSGFHLIVEAPPGTAFNVYIGLNPEEAVEMRLYKEKYTRVRSQWIPDELEAVELPYRGKMATAGIAGQTTQAFWMDFRAARDARVQRIKIEPQVSFDDRWAKYPMEARIAVSTAPPPGNTTVGKLLVLPPVTAPSDIVARHIFHGVFCDSPERIAPESPLTIRSLIARDAARDVAIAAALPTGRLWEAAGVGDRRLWCESDSPSNDGPEWYLRLRDRIINTPR